MSLLRHFYIIITNDGKSRNNDSIITCNAKCKPPFYNIIISSYNYVNYYNWFYYYPLLPVSVQRYPKLADEF